MASRATSAKSSSNGIPHPLYVSHNDRGVSPTWKRAPERLCVGGKWRNSQCRTSVFYFSPPYPPSVAEQCSKSIRKFRRYRRMNHWFSPQLAADWLRSATEMVCYRLGSSAVGICICYCSFWIEHVYFLTPFLALVQNVLQRSIFHSSGVAPLITPWCSQFMNCLMDSFSRTICIMTCLDSFAIFPWPFHWVLALKSSIFLSSHSLTKRYHLLHHRYQGLDGTDPDLPTAWEGQYFRNPIAKFFFILFQPFVYVTSFFFVCSRLFPDFPSSFDVPLKNDKYGIFGHLCTYFPGAHLSILVHCYFQPCCNALYGSKSSLVFLFFHCARYVALGI